MDEFSVGVRDAEILSRSHLVEELRDAAEDLAELPVILASEVETFHSVEGGYHERRDCHVVDLIHEVQGNGSPPQDIRPPEVEIHLDGTYWYLDVSDARTFDELSDETYPESDYVLSLDVVRYRRGPQSFFEELQADTDRRGGRV